MAEFQTQLSVANKYERFIGENFYPGCSYNDDYRYDILTKEGYKIEIKHDFQSGTGNIGIEYECRNKPSCLSTTESDYYIYIYPLLQELWMIKTEDLKKLIKTYLEGFYIDNWTTELFFKTNVPGGDEDEKYGGKVSRLHLMRRDDVRHLWKVKKMFIPIYEKE